VCPHTGVRGSIGRRSRVPCTVRGSTDTTPSSARTSSTSRSSRCSMKVGRVGAAALACPASMSPTTTEPVSAPSIRPAARWLATRGPGTSARPSSSKTRAASARPRPTPPTDSGRQRLNTPASPSRCQPLRSTTLSANSKERRWSRGNWPSHSRRTPSARSVSNSVSSKSTVGPRLYARSLRIPSLTIRPVWWPSAPRPAPWADRECARRRCCAGSGRCRRRWSARYPAASPPP
jgi:hypothetical protein